MAARDAARALRPQGWQLSDEPFTGGFVTSSTYVTASDDRLLDSRWFIQYVPALISAVDVVALPGGHSPMLAQPPGPGQRRGNRQPR